MPLLQRVRWWAWDYVYAGLRQLAVLQPPWGRRGHRPTPGRWAQGSPDLPEIVLLPGVYEHWTFLRPLGDALNSAGHRVRVVHGLGTNRRAVVATSERLGRALAARPVPAAGRVLVAHSKGGLVGKHLLVASGAAGAAAVEAAEGPDAAAPRARPLGLLGLVAICTPFSGSTLAGLFFVPSIRAFRPGDATIVSLGREESINGRIVSIFGRFDPHIPGGSALQGATNVLVPGSGHFRVLGDPRTHAAVIDGVRLLAEPELAAG
jgi:hypothetical protein